MMRRILVDAARMRGALKRGGGAANATLDEAAVVFQATAASVLALDDALTAFRAVAPRPAQVVELRYFGVVAAGDGAVALPPSNAVV